MPDFLDSLEQRPEHDTRDRDVRPTSPPSPDRASSDVDETCSNCGAGRQGAYCASCGQRFHERPLTFRGLVRDVVERVFDLDQGVLYTFWQLVLQPGEVSRQYVEGLRKPYVNPVAYVVISVAVSILLFNMLGDRIVEVMFWPYMQEPEALPIDPVQLWDQFMEPSLTYLTLLLAVPITLVIYFFYRKSHDYTFVETLIPVLYSTVQASLYGLVIFPFMLVVPPEIGFVLGQCSILVIGAVVGQTTYGFYDRTVKDFVLGFLGSIVGYIAAMFLAGIVGAVTVLVYVLTTG